MEDPAEQLSYGRAAGVGAAAGLLASFVQVGVGYALDLLVLPRGQDNNISPRLINRSARKLGQDTDPATDWALGSAFHFSYGLGWGALYELLKRWSGLPGLFLSSVLGWMIHLLAFSRQGIGTRTGTERPPEARPWRKQLSLVTVAWTYAFVTALTESYHERRPELSQRPATLRSRRGEPSIGGRPGFLPPAPRGASGAGRPG